MPPPANAVAPPFANPLQVTLESTEVDTTNGAGSVITTDELVVQPLASVTVTPYAPAVREATEVPAAPLDHARESAPVPPLAEALAPPFEPPLQVTLESTMEERSNAGGSVNDTEAVTGPQPLASVTETVCVPAAKFITEAVAAPLDQEYPYGATPPIGVTVAEPLPPALHVKSLCEVMEAFKTGGSVILAVVTAGPHPLTSVTVTV